MRRRAQIGGILRFPLVLALCGGALIAALLSAHAQVDRTSPRERPGVDNQTMGARPSRSPLATEDARPIDADRDDAYRPAGEPETVSRPRHIQDCIESSRNNPRWQEKHALAEPHCAER
jgi:hypothetical protein